MARTSGSRNRGRSELAKHRRLISQYYLMNMTQPEIAEKLGLSQATVCRDLSSLVKSWQEISIDKIDERKRIELAKIDNLELTYWHEWEESKTEKKIASEKASVMASSKKSDKDDDKGHSTTTPIKQEKSVRKEERSGDPRYLQGVQWCINKRCEILGIDAPKKSQISGDELKPVRVLIDIPDNGRNKPILKKSQ